MAIDMEKVKDRVLKGAYVGAGSFASSFVENLIEDNLFDNDLAIGVSQLAVGAGMSIGVDQVFQQPDSVPNQAVEFAGYGIQGSAWSSLADSFQTGQVAGNRSVSVSTDGGSQTGQTVEVTRQDGGNQTEDEVFRADIG